MASEVIQASIRLANRSSVVRKAICNSPALLSCSAARLSAKRGDVAHVLGPERARQAEARADVLLDRLAAGGAGELHAEQGAGVVDVDLVADQRAVVDADVFGDAKALRRFLGGCADRGQAFQVAVEQVVARLQHFLVGGEAEHRLEHRLAVLHRRERAAQVAGRRAQELRQRGDEVARQQHGAVELALRLGRIALHPGHGVERVRLRPHAAGGEERHLVSRDLVVEQIGEQARHHQVLERR